MIEQIKKDREGGTWGSWSVFGAALQVDIGSQPSGSNPCIIHWGGFDGNDLSKKTNRNNARRIARVPELEEYVLEAHELLKEVLAGACVNYAYIAPRNIERIKKLVGEA